MYACLLLPRRAEVRLCTACEKLVQLARDFSPRVELHGEDAVTLDITGLGLMFPGAAGREPKAGSARAIGEEMRRMAADRGLRLHIAIAASTTAALLLAHARAGLTIVPAGEEGAALAPLPLSVLEWFVMSRPNPAHPEFDQLTRWGLRTLGDLAAISSSELSARLGQAGLMWQRWARGQDARPLVPVRVEEPFSASLDLEWPIEGLEPLSFVLARLFDPLCERLEREDRGAVALTVSLTLVTREVHARTVPLPAPMRDARVLRTLALLDLESHPPVDAIDRVTVSVEVTEGRILQFGLFARALPAEKLATLVARLGALMGSDRVGAPALVDSHRPGAFAMKTFEPPRHLSPPPPSSSSLPAVLRRFRSPIAARVVMEQGRPVRVHTDRRGFTGGRVERCEGPWRSSGAWWQLSGWNCDEWDVTLTDGASYRLVQTHDTGQWSLNGIVD